MPSPTKTVVAVAVAAAAVVMEPATKENLQWLKQILSRHKKRRSSKFSKFLRLPVR
jgi:disulfide oxidoreductase YuzD